MSTAVASAGFAFWGVFAASGLAIGAFAVWMLVAERREHRTRDRDD